MDGPAPELTPIHLERHLRAHTPAEYQDTLTDYFERILMHDLSVTEARVYEFRKASCLSETWSGLVETRIESTQSRLTYGRHTSRYASCRARDIRVKLPP